MNLALKRSLQYVFLGGIATSVMDTLAVGPTLIAYALLFGAGPLSVGILGAIPYIGNLIHLLVAWMIERGYSVKKIAVYSSFLSRPFYLFAALLAFIPDSVFALPLLIIFLTLSYLIGCMSGGAYMPWMKMLIPVKIMGRFFAYRYKWMMIAKIICFFFAYFLIKYVQSDYPEMEIYGFAFLLVLAFCAALYGAWTFLYVEDCDVPRTPEISFVKKVIRTFSNIPFRRILFSLSVLNFSMAFVTPFVTLFLLKRIGLPMSAVLMMTLVMQLAYAFVIKKLGKFTDRKGPSSLLVSCVPLFVLSLVLLIVLNAFVSVLTPSLLYIVIGGIHIILGIATAGLTLGINNLSLMYMPKKQASVYLSVNSVMKSFAGAIGSIIAGVLFLLCVRFESFLQVQTEAANGWTSFYIIAILLSVFSIVLLRTVRACDAEQD